MSARSWLEAVPHAAELLTEPQPGGLGPNYTSSFRSQLKLHLCREGSQTSVHPNPSLQTQPHKLLLPSL